ncbi:hypothetical protein PHLGIDRAFT_62555 [Phlebiopsis gigantea 11061_1 CR5-6]|uniref:Polyketide synthase-like phosphopantetheine-binding domain-containing protein n=1 Tax=Phlebiopsis gigantea (strain 11061_1 CR5-6) TaxID=745531 RepID=A0A0C3SDV7_PHLG1|nr:hypothetical protein PHLGIDRAFT_62555 [Phlebiopsis gigantea 11061_1 CR5-6]
MKLILPPLDGSLATLIDFADFQARHNALLPWFIFPSPSSTGQLASISFAELATSSHQIASILRPGRSGPDNEIIVLLLHTDNAIYVPVVLGVLRAGHIPFFVSPRNSVEAVCHMLRLTGCRRLLFNNPTAKLAVQVNADMSSEGIKLQLENINIFHDIFSDLLSGRLTSIDTLPYPTTTVDIDMNLPMVYLHSSGSTGLPKSIPIPRILLLQNLRQSDTRFGAVGLPTFHSMGLVLQIFYPLCTSRPVAVFTPQYPAPPLTPNAKAVIEACKLTGCQGLVAPPSFIESWSRSQDDVDYLKTLTVLVFGGGPLSIPVGDRMASEGVPLSSGYGGTEFGGPTASWDELRPDELQYNPNWAWIRFSNYVRTEWEPQGDGTYELIIHDTDEYKVRVYNVPGRNAYATRDLFVPHPTEAGLWRIVARKDDVITLSTGEKIVPIAQESRINASPLVSGCVMFGREQEQAGLLVEVAAEHSFEAGDEAALASFRNKIWPTVDDANLSSPAFGRIYKEMIIVTYPAKPLPRSGKNTVVRKQALAFYAREINALYTTIKESTAARDVPVPESWQGEGLRAWLQNEASSLLRKVILRNVDLFHQGLDSLSATFFRNRIVGALRSSADESIQQASWNVPSNLIFDYSTIEALAEFVSSLVGPLRPASPNPSGVRAEEIDSLIIKYARGLPPKSTRTDQATRPTVVLLTGATGNIGSHILASLLDDARIAQVYTLDRPSGDPAARLRSAFGDRLLPVDLVESPKLVCLGGALSEDFFGLQKPMYDEVLRSVTHVVHNAWTVNFNLPLHAFEDQISGVRKLVDASASTSRSIRLLVTSSIGVATKWDPVRGPIPERLLNDPSIATTNGYSASKYVVEEATAAAQGHSVMCVRMGQVCGPQATGAWSMSEWIPMMLKSSITLGSLPRLSGPVTWVPLDVVGKVYIDWITNPEQLPLIVNAVHPRPITWELVLKYVKDALEIDLRSIPLSEWVDRLENSAATASLEDLAQLVRGFGQTARFITNVCCSLPSNS